jgi:hypothetical protein
MRRIRVYTPEALAAAISSVAMAEVDFPQIRRTALAVVARAPRREWPELLHEYILRTTRWIPERGEIVESPIETLRLGAADCDGLTALYLALAWAVGLDARPMLVGDHDQPTHAVAEVMTSGGWRQVEVSSPRGRQWRHAWRNTKEDAMDDVFEGLAVGSAHAIVRIGAQVNPVDQGRAGPAKWCSTPDGAERWLRTDARGFIDDTACPCPNVPVPTNRPPEPWETEARRVECGGEPAARRRARKKAPGGGGAGYRRKVPGDWNYQPGEWSPPNGDHGDLADECGPGGRHVLACWDGPGRLASPVECAPGQAPQCRDLTEKAGAGFPWWILLVAYYATKKK